ncbi:TOMM precursor leader peptide-binding protein [Streptantibioticus cattleyicolor]|uniref:TOMM leader peptide-binding protein n=1 Tax=Streptantibioticus cattleyicolor (strain ATCC 35852 / DSM 46488 / JCM 4925 / NBRC 14057 / NRRL 8057) TaxID=1003195 RepID=F8JJM2_STREN|nr:TOMM precursor leader peptide-binding protein [Streptantibioticus cattleyicolor]AEW99931.1 hypothetical protein SCATT_p17380 [Streptantibioticus cattleyicolor NRRL 8057 = DSM 46488]CCB71036.1 protein of unknown function [Streptantibioticus cattleyicolor NRRL 8057 = DSM 46488]
MGVPPLHLVALDAWGEAVVPQPDRGVVVSAVSAAPRAGAGGRTVSAAPATWPQAGCHVVACAREDVSFFRDVDTFCFLWSLTWAPLVLTPRGVRLGPVVVPGRSACYHCFLRRQRQHDWDVGDTQAWWDSVTRDPSNCVAGWLPSDVLMARGLTRVLAARGPGAFAGTVVTYDGVTGDVSGDPVTGVHACPRCRRRPDRRADTWTALAQQFPPPSATACPPVSAPVCPAGGEQAR